MWDVIYDGTGDGITDDSMDSRYDMGWVLCSFRI